MNLKRTIITAIAAAGALVAPATAAAVPAGSTALIDRPSGFGGLPFDGANFSATGPHSISADGRYVVFESASDVILDGDNDQSFNVYRLDRQRGVIEQVNTTSDGVPQGPNESFFASISADGRYVAFSSFGPPLSPGAPELGVFVKDMTTGKVELASRSTGANGAPASGQVITQGTISGDGRHVAFVAVGPVHADNADGKPDQADVFLRNLDAGTTHLVSLKPDGTAGGGFDGDGPPVPDFDGHNVAFISDSQLDPDDKDTGDDAYMRTDIGKASEETCFLSFTTGQTRGAEFASQVDVGGKGDDVAWSDENGVFYSQENAQAVPPATRVDVAQTGGSSSDDADLPAFEPVAAAGDRPKRLYFRTSSELSPSDDNRDDDIYDAEVPFIGNPDHLHLDTSGEHHASIRDVAGAKQGAIVVYDGVSSELPGSDVNLSQVYQHVNGVDRNISQPPGRAARSNEAGDGFVEFLHAVSDDGTKVVFATRAPALGGASDQQQIAMRNVVTGKSSLISAQPDGSPTRDSSSHGTVDAAGDKVAFTSSGGDLLVTGNPIPGGPHVYVRDLVTGDVTLVDRRDDGKVANGSVESAVIAPDGRHVAYTSTSSDLPGAPPANNLTHAYVVDLTTGRSTLVDKTPSGTVANARVRPEIDVSGDGSAVAFVSPATNLGVAGSDSQQQTYVRNLRDRTLTWASIPGDGDPSHSDSGAPSLSRDGNRVAFDQDDQRFGHGMDDSASQVFVRDLQEGTTVLAGDIPGAEAASARNPSLSADGKRVVFGAVVGDDLRSTLAPAALKGELSAPALAAKAAAADSGPEPPSGIYLRDLGRTTPTLVTVRPDGAPAETFFFSNAASIDGTGACVAFSAGSVTPITDPSYGSDFTHVYLRAVDDDCPGAAAHPEPPAETPPGGNPPSGGGPAPGTGKAPHDGGDGLPPVDKTAPAISSAKLTARTFAVGRTSTVRNARAAVGTTISFSLSEPAATSIAISQRTIGRKKGTRCVAPERGLKKRCTRVVEIVTLKRAATVAGVNRTAFTGKVGRTTLKPGSYQAVLTARDKAGNVSKPVKLTFTVVKR